MKTSIWTDEKKVCVRNDDAKCSSIAWKEYSSEKSAKTTARRLQKNSVAAEKFYLKVHGA